MRRAASTPPLLLLAGFAACTCQRAPAPILTEVAPAQARTDVFALLAIRGEHFRSRVTVDFDSPGSSPVDSTFGLWLVASTVRVPLQFVSLVSESELWAWYPALAAAPGTYDLELLDPRGNRAVLPQAFAVLASKCGGQADGTPCEDGDACTAGETCQAGKCGSPTSVVTCTPTDPCVAHARCDPATGFCQEDLKDDGANCSDGNACTLSARCLAGVCTRTALVSCAPPAECRLPGTCDPAAQSCQYPAKPDGTSCVGPGTCVAGATCQAGACACVSTAPLACLTVTPTSGAAGTTSFTFDASCSSDAEDPTSALQVRFFDADGAFDTGFGSAQTASFTYPDLAPGSPPLVRSVYAEVMDTGNFRAFARQLIAVFAPGDEVLVTTELDSGAGSLREAIATVNALAVPKAITFSGPYQIVLSSALPALQTDGAVIVGLPGVVVDCNAVNKSCLSVIGSGRILGLEVSGSSNGAIQLDGAGYQVAGCRIVNASAKGASVGILASGTGTIGPGNDVSGAHYGIEVTSTGIAIDGNRIHDNAIGVGARGSGLVIQRNFVYSNATYGVQVSNCAGSAWLNTVEGNGQDGLTAGTLTALDVRDNLFTNNGGFGVSGAARLSPFDYNGYLGNAQAADTALGAYDVTADPRYVDRAAGDFRLLPGSPAVNAGVDVGLDVNGPESGNFDGAAPDLGAFETPY